ncbi:Cut9-interacting protein scn1 [Podospora aff. communis PSN243]|uniref:Cut9-interacting protein scn1 n=1 Tax=Podospora aff. communis PSN243 TaxID=3040156 RepID=A0AAV9GSG8_9PEZI|nr:Cut9-interacting protein scn1 [Podospora aff. communis PSN243]
MCPPTGEQSQNRDGDDAAEGQQTEPFPWHLGAADAHCHVTDTMPSVTSIANMKARVLTIMATRSQDQDLVSSVAAQQKIRSRADLNEPPVESSDRIVPAFGWHPWFSYQFYNDAAGEPTFDSSAENVDQEKARHYAEVLAPSPSADFIASLPVPRPLSSFITETRNRLNGNPVALIGEIGVDRAFRLPQEWSQGEEPERDENLTPGGREGRLLSPYHVKVPHQVQILEAQLRLAGELGRAVSVHGVQAHGVLFDALASLWKGHEKEVISRRKQRLVAEGAEDFSSDEDSDDDFPRKKDQAIKKPYKPKPFPPRVCLHSFSGPPQMLKQYLNPAIPIRIFFSFSMVVNLSSAGLESKFVDVIKACPDDLLLVESDLHMAGEEMDRVLEQMYRKVCGIKGWTLTEGLQRIRKNYEGFIFG